MRLSIGHRGTQENPTAFPASLPHFAVFRNKARCQQSRTRPGSQGSEGKQCPGDDSRQGKVAHCSPAVTHGNAMPKAVGEGCVWQHILPLASRITYED